MAYVDALQTRLEDLLEGNAGTAPWTLPLGHFRVRVGPDPLELFPADAAERQVDVDVGPATPYAPVNHLDGYGLFTHPVRVRVSYILTGQGDAFDAPGEQSGAATDTAVRNRATADAHAVFATLGYLGNWSGLTDPHVIDVYAPPGSPLGDLAPGPERAILTVTMQVLVRAALPGVSLRAVAP